MGSPERGISARTAGVVRAFGWIEPPPLKWSTLRHGFGQARRTAMLRKRHKPEEIVAKLHQIDVLVSQG